MKIIHPKILLLIFICVFSVMKTEARRSPDAANLSAAFTNFQISNSVIFDFQVQNTLQRDYYTELKKLRIEYFSGDEKAKKAISYFSTQKGMQEVLTEWFQQNHSDSGYIYSFGVLLIKKFLAMANRVSEKVYEKVPSKYARLLIEHEPDNAQIIIDHEPVSVVKEAKMGIVVSSNTSYEFNLRLDKDYCQQTIICQPAEDKVIVCK